MSDLLIMKKRILLDRSEVLYDKPFGPDSLTADWEARRGEWSTDGEWLTGVGALNDTGMITGRRPYFGNVMLEFQARTVAPSNHDIDCMWNGSWDPATNKPATAYIMGLPGWWSGKVGFEKSPDYKLHAMTPLFDFQAGRIYRVQVGSVDGHLFLFADGQLLIEATDPDPIDNTIHGLVGLEAYSATIQFRNLIIRRLAFQPREQKYAPQ